jgi:uncharacterized protein
VSQEGKMRDDAMLSSGGERVAALRALVHEVLENCPDAGWRRNGYVHLYGVSGICVLLALRRGLDVEIAATIGMLHDIATYGSGDPKDHARRSAEVARRMLRAGGGFSEAEVDTICRAIEGHSDKGARGGCYDDLIRDADVLQAHLAAPWEPEAGDRAARLEGVLQLLEATPGGRGR